jgi:regulatory protein
VNEEADPEGKPTKRMLSWARNSAAYRLGKQMLTERQLADAIARKAKQKFEDINGEQISALVDCALAFGHEMKALDDANYAEIKGRSAGRAGKSKKAIARTLALKGVAKSHIDNALLEADDLTAAVILARKRGYGPFRRHELDDKQKAKELSGFARNGFSFEISKKVFAMDPDEAEDILFHAKYL